MRRADTSADRPENQRQPQVSKRPRGSAVGRLLDSSTKKSQTLNRFGNTFERQRCVPTHRNARIWLASDSCVGFPPAHATPDFAGVKL